MLKDKISEEKREKDIQETNHIVEVMKEKTKVGDELTDKDW